MVWLDRSVGFSITLELSASSSGILGRAATALASARVNICAVAQGSSERNITIVVAEEDAEAGVAALHDSGCCGRGGAAR